MLPDVHFANPIYLNEFFKNSTTEKWDLILMQFTGIKYKDGTEWYEGDVIENDGDRYQIVWDDVEARFEALSTHGGEDLPLGELHTIGTYVIGNIYQNPELLEVAHE